jgi:hypothetical protein
VLIPPFGAEQDKPIGMDSILRGAFWRSLVAMIVMQASSACRVRLAGARVPGEPEAREPEGAIS